jgi:hypothetical protein
LVDSSLSSAVGVAGVIEGVGKGRGQAGAAAERADGKQPCVAGELVRRRLGKVTVADLADEGE